jgi:hypothetical protein
MDSDAKKKERLKEGLNGDLYEQLNLVESESYHELVNKAISQEHAMRRA